MESDASDIGAYEQEQYQPMEWRDSVIIPVYKEKGDIIQDFGNYRGINLMSRRPTMKIWERNPVTTGTVPAVPGTSGPGLLLARDIGSKNNLQSVPTCKPIIH